MKFNKKGQGALEYLLLIGGAVLIAVIVIALLVGMGSSSRANTEKNANDLTGAEAVVPSYITSAACTDGNFYITLSALETTRYDYNLIVDNSNYDEISANPYIGTDGGCADGNVLKIMTKSRTGQGIAVSNEFTVRD
jgi:uncharacterized protein (UPF0333 family)